jgi:hypothetical protein
MLVLIGTKPGFAISEQWILERTGLKHASYINARRDLCEMGWLTLDPSKTITVNFSVIHGEKGNTTLPKEKSSNEKGNTTLPKIGNTTLPKIGNTTLPIINNNTTDKIIDNREPESASIFVF